MQRRRKGPRYRPNTPESGVFVRPTLVGGDGFLPYHLALEPILAAKASTVRTVVARLGKKSPVNERRLEGPSREDHFQKRGRPMAREDLAGRFNV